VTAAPTDREIRFGHARVLLQLDRLDEAIAQLGQVLEPVDATTPRSLYALSVALVRQGDVEKGRRHAQRALDLAREYDQQDLAAAIARDLARLPPSP
jgi:tetratricopeptide (TPR) repeat protein